MKNSVFSFIKTQYPRISRDPYNSVGKNIIAECKANRVTYAYACVNKIITA